MYRLVITVVPPGPAAQASSAYRVFAPDEPSPFAFTACLWGDGSGAQAEAEGRAAAERHAGGAVEVEVVREERAAGGDGATALAALAALTDELDGLQTAARETYPAEVTCKRGCDSCCHQRVGVSRVEVARLAAAVAALSDEARAALAATVARVATLTKPRCGALDDSGGCQLYGARPVVCRSHGLVYLTHHRKRGSSLPVRQRSCSLNYNGQMPVAPHLYDFAHWSDRLMAIDDAFADEAGFGADLTVGRSIGLAEVLSVLLSPAG